MTFWFLKSSVATGWSPAGISVSTGWNVKMSSVTCYLVSPSVICDHKLDNVPENR